MIDPDMVVNIALGFLAIVMMGSIVILGLGLLLGFVLHWLYPLRIDWTAQYDAWKNPPPPGPDIVDVIEELRALEAKRDG
jgi:hypothetical protein